jgi:N-acyl-D-aspartate/D-glutamate deacylase
MAFDVVIRDGLVVDGTGSPAFRADVGVSDGRIVDIGTILDSAAEEIDAEGHVVSPGFIDGHTHMDAQIFWDPIGSCSCWHGVTSVLMGNCGFTLAPAREFERELVVRNLERAEDISAEAMALGINWTWETFPEYMDTIDKLPKAINYAVNVGHSALRTWAMGERAFEDEASPEDLRVMSEALRASLAAGALGLSTSRTRHHLTSDDRPVASRIASWDEVTYLARELSAGRGKVLEIALEDDSYSPDPDVRKESHDRLRRLAIESGVPVTYGIVPVESVGSSLLGLIDSTNDGGGQMFGMSHSRGVSITLSFKGNLPFDKLTDWRWVRSLSLEGQRAALLDQATRRRLVAAANNGPYGDAVGGEARKPDYDMIQVMQTPLPPHLTVAEMARQRNIDPVDLMIDLALESDFNQLFIQPLRRYDDDELLTVMRHPATVMTFSDSGAHVSQILDCSIQTHLLGYWVREREAFTLEEGVSMVTGVPARRFQIPERGVLQVGAIADINVFNPKTIGPEMPSIAHDLPGGGMRLKQQAKGFLATMVAGRVTLRDGEPTGAYPGQLIRSS